MDNTKNTPVLTFGTDGIRGRADQSPFTQEVIVSFGRAIARWVCQKNAKTAKPVILIGMDTRESGPAIMDWLITGMIQENVSVIDGGVLPTPAVCQIIQSDPEQWHAGVVISASHNPYYDNGIKLFDARQGKLTHEDEACILAEFDVVRKGQNSVRPERRESERTNEVEWVRTGSATKLDALVHAYGQAITSHFPKHFLQGLSIVLDCANGATSVIAPEVFAHCGAHVITLADQPTGKNINEKCGALHPEFVAQAVKEYGADVGFAFDGDGDRLVMVNRHGVIADGDDVLVMLMQHPAYAAVRILVSTIMANEGLRIHLETLGKTLVRTPVGDKYVAAYLAEHNLPLGAEPSGHVIVRDFLGTSDGIFVALKVLESMLRNKNNDLVTFAKFPQVLVSVHVKNKKELSAPPLSSIIEDYKKMLKDGRMIVRFSGTEHVLRVMVELSDEEIARTVARDLAQALQLALE